jgi:ribosomal protein L30E
MCQDVTEIIGTGKVDLGFKAMIHTLAVSLLWMVTICSSC